MMRRFVALATLAGSAGFCGVASAHNFDLPLGFEAEWKLPGNYALAARTGNPAKELIDGDVDPLRVSLDQNDANNGQSFGHTGLPPPLNFDHRAPHFRPR